MKKQGNTISQSVSLPADLTEKIDKAWHKHTRKFLNAKVSRSKFISQLLEKALEHDF